MNIGIDANCIIFDHSGFGRYATNVVENLLKFDRKNHYFLYASFVRHPDRRKVLDKIIEETGAKNATVKIIKFPAQWKEFLTGFPISLKNFIKEDLDLYFAPHFSGIPFKGFDHNIVSIQDLVFMKYPHHRGRHLSHYYLKRTKIALKNSEEIIASSRSTKKDLVDLLGVPEGKIEVVPLGVGPEFKVIRKAKEAEEVVNQYLPKKIKYILSVSTLEPRKNLPVLIRAFSLLPNHIKREYKIVLVGGKGWNNQELKETITDFNLYGKIIFTGFVPDHHLPYIYNRASVFVFPSLYEGFGLPPLEAMACGCPVICSNTSSLPEVVGKAAITFNPHHEEELARAIEKVLRLPRLAEKMSKKGVIQAKKFSWAKTAQETLGVFGQFKRRK